MNKPRKTSNGSAAPHATKSKTESAAASVSSAATAAVPSATAPPSSTANAFTPGAAASTTKTSVEERIRRRAFQLYQERQGQSGTEVNDWLRAEEEVLANAGRAV